MLNNTLNSENPLTYLVEYRKDKLVALKNIAELNMSIDVAEYYPIEKLRELYSNSNNEHLVDDIITITDNIFIAAATKYIDSLKTNIDGLNASFKDFLIEMDTLDVKSAHDKMMAISNDKVLTEYLYKNIDVVKDALDLISGADTHDMCFKTMMDNYKALSIDVKLMKTSIESLHNFSFLIDTVDSVLKDDPTYIDEYKEKFISVVMLQFENIENATHKQDFFDTVPNDNHVETFMYVSKMIVDKYEDLVTAKNILNDAAVLFSKLYTDRVNSTIDAIDLKLYMDSATDTNLLVANLILNATNEIKQFELSLLNKFAEILKQDYDMFSAIFSNYEKIVNKTYIL